MIGKQMRVLGVIDHFGSGGAQRQFTELMAGLASRGHHVEVFIYHPGHQFFRARLETAGIRIRECDRNLVGIWGTLKALRRAVEEIRPQAVISFLSAPNMLAEVVRVGRRIPVLLVSERSSWHGDRSPLVAWAGRALHVCADRVVTNSEYHGEWLEDRFPWLRGRVRCIYNGIAPEYFDIPSPARPSGELRLLAIGRISRDKNPLVVAEACALFAARHGWSPRVTWVGRPGERTEDGPHRATVDAVLAREPRVATAWRWIGESKQVPRLMAEHHLLVHPSLYEGLPNVVCEALAAGRPVLASHVCEHPRLIGPAGERGRLFRPDDPAELVFAIESVAAQSIEDWITMTERCKAFAQAQLAVDRMVTRYEALIAEVDTR
jgi:glycosyltransferase involved in cell wall biosynthesis